MTKVTQDRGTVTVAQGGVVAVSLQQVNGDVVATWWDVLPPFPFALPIPMPVTDGAGAAVPVKQVVVADGTRLVLMGSNARDDVTGGSGADMLDGGGGDDYLSGRDGNDVLSGGAGRDALWGGKGADSLSGGTDADWLYGGAGADTLEGGPGQDYLEGGTGADVFRFRRSDAGARPDLEFSDWVEDFARAEGDVIELTGFAVGATVQHRGEGYYEVREGEAVVAKFHVTRTGTDAAGKPVAIAITDLGPGDFVFLGSVAAPGAPPAPAPAPAPRPVAGADLPGGKEAVVLAPATGEEAASLAPATGEEAAILALATGEEAAILAPAAGEEAAILAPATGEAAILAPATGEEAAILATATGDQAAILYAAPEEDLLPTFADPVTVSATGTDEAEAGSWLLAPAVGGVDPGWAFL